jgi:DNA gyrase inhibitor GyrI
MTTQQEKRLDRLEQYLRNDDEIVFTICFVNPDKTPNKLCRFTANGLIAIDEGDAEPT